MNRKLLRRIHVFLAAALLFALTAAGCGSSRNTVVTLPESTTEGTTADFFTADEGTTADFLIADEETTADFLTEDAAGKEDTAASEDDATEGTTDAPGISVERDGEYSDKEHVALYLHEYGELPSNYITKKEAESLGWVSSRGNLWKVAPGKSIGGSYFGNYEGRLPEKKGRKYYECDIDFDGTYRNAKRIIYSNDGLIYYTEDHYETFELLYGEE